LRLVQGRTGSQITTGKKKIRVSGLEGKRLGNEGLFNLKHPNYGGGRIKLGGEKKGPKKRIRGKRNKKAGEKCFKRKN